MKIAWLCYTHTSFYLEEEQEVVEEEQEVVIEFKEPESWKYAKIVPIVYAEIIK